MSFTDRLVLWLHIGFAIFAIGPVTIAIMTTPRYIRKRNLVVVQFLYRTTFIYTLGSLAVLVAGVILADLLHDFSKPWLTVSLTLFIVALVLLALILRDQHGAIAALEDAEAEAEEAEATVAAAAGGSAAADAAASLPPAAGQPGAAHQELHLAHVERGRIASLGGVVALIWLVILVLMVWNG
jgi:predicted membrane-bound mannosyltransferase